MSDRFFTTRKLVQYYLPLTLTLFMTVSIERNVLTDGGYDRLFGLPLPYISSALGYSFNHQVYILPMIVNLIFYFSLTVLIVAGLTKIGLQPKTHSVFITVGVLIIIFWVILFYSLTSDSDFHFINDTNYTTTKRTIVWGIH